MRVARRAGRGRARRARTGRRRGRGARAGVPMPWITSGSATRSPTRMRGSSEAIGSWKIICTSRRTALRRRRGRRGLRPAISIVPAKGTRPAMALGDRGLAAAAFADQRQGLAGPDVEADALDGVDAVGDAAEEAAAQVEGDAQVGRRGRRAAPARDPAPARPRPRPCAARRRAARGCRARAARANSARTGGLLDHAPVLHDDDAVGHLGDHAHVVGDQDDRGAEARAAGRAAGRAPRACTVTSSAVVGSSAISTSGFSASAMAIITRWRMPPESSCGYWARRRSGSEMRTASQRLDGAGARLGARRAGRGPRSPRSAGGRWSAPG